MAQISQSTVDHSKTDIANNPNHVQAQQLEALTPAATRPASPGQLEDQDQDQDDMEDKLSNALAPTKAAAGGKSRSGHGSKKPRQKKIAVLTSGGDSAGMNAAGGLSMSSMSLLIQTKR
jgi:hypothetical protein